MPTANKLFAISIEGGDRVRRAAAYIDANLERDISLMDICGHTRTSRCQMCRLFRACLGCTFCEYLTGRRMARAAALLRNTSLPCQEVASACGFASASYFTTVFRKHTGLPPARFRAQQLMVG